MNPQKSKLLSRFSASVRKEYGDRLLGLYVFDYLFGDSGDDDEVSADTDVAVILTDGDWNFLEEKKRLVRLTFEILLDTEVYIRAWPLPASAWADPSTHANPVLVRDIKRHSEPILEAV
jgi:hypothetical protein